MTHTIYEELERRILHGLACEWEAAVFLLPPEQRKRMKMPLFSIMDANRRLGSWSPEKREIAISRNLALNHPWDCIREVLLHEMAHQYVSEVLRIKKETPHGDSFKQACRIFRTDPKASGGYMTLHERIKQGGSVADENDRIVGRIKKLLALAESKNRHEAEAALVKAHELVARYNIDLIRANENRNFVSMFLGKPALRHYREAYKLANLLRDFYFIYAIWVSAYVLNKGKMGRVLEISGEVKNVQLAGYVYDCINQYINDQWLKYDKIKKLGRYRKTDFAEGILDGFREKLEKSCLKQKRTDDGYSLIVVNDPLLNRYVKRRYPHTRSFTRTASRLDADVRKAGIKAGKKLVISEGVTNEMGHGGFLPEPDGK